MVKTNWLQWKDCLLCIRNVRKGYAHVEAEVAIHSTSEWPTDEALFSLVDGTYDVQDGIVSGLTKCNFGGHITVVSQLVKTVHVYTD